jgi:S-adenosylmethionine:tRNA ribosyltransferase-isomerase
MRLSEFFYKLPKELVAQKPVSPRDHSRLLVLDRAGGHVEHRHFFDLPKYLRRGDLLVLNDTKVFPARLIGKKEKTGGKVEVFLLRKTDLTPALSLQRRGSKGEVWQCLVGGKHRQAEQQIIFSKKLQGKILLRQLDGTWLIGFNLIGKSFWTEINQIGEVPLPPYIKRNKPSKADEARYQTVYADEKHLGSVAAPTAGLHFTPGILKKIKAVGVEPVYLTLHVGLGTFLPVKTENIKKHKMHAEWYEINKAVLARIVKAKKAGRRIIAVGTTSARVLETVFSKKSLHGLSGWTDIFIYPGYKFKTVDALVTNFHLPESTLLMLVSAFAGQAEKNKSAGLNKIKKTYREAVKKGYRFFSFGDAMLIK